MNPPTPRPQRPASLPRSSLDPASLHPASIDPAAQQPPLQQPSPPQRYVVDRAQIRSWLRLKREMAELQARLEYLKLLMKLGVR